MSYLLFTQTIVLKAQISHRHETIKGNDYVSPVPLDLFISTLEERRRIEARNKAILERKREFDNYYRSRSVPSDYQSVTFYATFPDYGNFIEIWIDGEYHSWISNGYYKNGSGCNSNSERAVYKFYGKPGTYKITAVSQNDLRWEFYFTVEFDRCKEHGLSIN